MKKSNQVFRGFVLSFIFLSQSMFGMLLGTIFYAVQKNMDRSRSQADNINSMYKKLQDEWNEDIARGKIGLGVLEKRGIPASLQISIGDSIDAILNDTIVVQGKESSLFPTANSKIFVLKNIRDFFNLEYDVLNQFVYEESIKRIRNLESTLTFVPEKETINGKIYEVEGKGYYVDSDSDAKKIDELRERYMQEYGLFVKHLQYLEDMSKIDKDQFKKDLNEDIERVKRGLLEVLAESANEVYYEKLEKQKKHDYSAKIKAQMLSESSPEVIAHISILAYLMYWKAQPQRTLSKSDIAEKAKLAKEKKEYVTGLREKFKDQSPKEISELTSEQRARLARGMMGQSLKMKLSRTPIEEAQQRVETRETLKSISKPQQQPAQTQSYWSRFKAWLGW
jgi:hypothetical protein